jgi:hypothetical protein
MLGLRRAAANRLLLLDYSSVPSGVDRSGVALSRENRRQLEARLREFLLIRERQVPPPRGRRKHELARELGNELAELDAEGRREMLAGRRGRLSDRVQKDWD